jgi:5'-nucleotidase
LKILLTNDDGIDSTGLRQLQTALQREHDVWVVAPDSNRSGSSHSITLGNPTKFSKRGEREYASGGTPADCVLHACLGLVPVEIDMVVAGINLGPNLGTDIVYSGTAAAARQGAFLLKPAVACSLSTYHPPYYLDFPVEFMVRNPPNPWLQSPPGGSTKTSWFASLPPREICTASSGDRLPEG